MLPYDWQDFHYQTLKGLLNPFIFINRASTENICAHPQNGKLRTAFCFPLVPTLFPLYVLAFTPTVCPQSLNHPYPVLQCFICAPNEKGFAPAGVKNRVLGAAFSQVKLCFVALSESCPNFSNKMKLFWIIEIRNWVALFPLPSPLSLHCPLMFFLYFPFNIIYIWRIYGRPSSLSSLSTHTHMYTCREQKDLPQIGV